MGVETNHTRRLDDLMSSHQTEFNVLQEALKEVAQEDGEKRKGEVKGLIRQALALQDSMNQAERTFNGEKKKFDKQLGKLLNKLEAMVRGQPAPDDEEEKKDD